LIEPQAIGSGPQTRAVVAAAAVHFKQLSKLVKSEQIRLHIEWSDFERVFPPRDSWSETLFPPTVINHKTNYRYDGKNDQRSVYDYFVSHVLFPTHTRAQGDLAVSIMSVSSVCGRHLFGKADTIVISDVS
jgi:hypothetical protein